MLREVRREPVGLPRYMESTKSPPVTSAAVHCDGLVHIYRSAETEVVALRGLDLIVEEGETVALSGPSGAGKSTLLWLLAGLLRPSAGGVWIHGQELSRLPAAGLDRLRAENLGVVLQNPTRNLIPHASAAQNISFAQRAGPYRSRERRNLANELLDAVGLLGAAHRSAGALSGGEQQRLALAVALANRPRLLLADEPTSQLDRRLARGVVTLLASVPEVFGATVVTVTHDPIFTELFGRTLTIRDGRVGTEGRHGEDHVVVGRDGGVMLPPHSQDALPPGSRARVVLQPDGVRLVRTDYDEPPP
jgi:putative ABC transport system ATP-binding protein